MVEVINPRRGAFSETSVQVLEYLTGLAASAIWHAQLFAATSSAEQRYLTLFQDSIDPILITDLDGKIVDANARALQFTGYTREEMLKLRIQALHPIYTGKLGQRFADIPNGEVRNYESRLRTKSGNQAPVELYIKRIPGAETEQDTIQWIVRDIAERAELDELRSDLTSMLFHDMRSPLGNVISSLQLLNDPPPADETMKLAAFDLAALGAAPLADDRLAPGPAPTGRRPRGHPRARRYRSRRWPPRRWRKPSQWRKARASSCSCTSRWRCPPSKPIPT